MSKSSQISTAVRAGNCVGQAEPRVKYLLIGLAAVKVRLKRTKRSTRQASREMILLRPKLKTP